MTKWRLIVDEPPWLRLFDESDQLVATELITGPIAEFLAHLKPGDRLDVMADDVPVSEAPPAHRCAGPELLTSRMQLALLSNDMPAYDVVVGQVGDCHRCWGAIAHWALNLLAGNRAWQAGSPEAAAGFVLKEIARMTAP